MAAKTHLGSRCLERGFPTTADEQSPQKQRTKRFDLLDYRSPRCIPKGANKQRRTPRLSLQQIEQESKGTLAFSFFGPSHISTRQSGNAHLTFFYGLYAPLKGVIPRLSPVRNTRQNAPQSRQSHTPYQQAESCLGPSFHAHR